MSKRPLNKIDLVPDWIRQTVAAAEAAEKGIEAPKDPSTKHEFSVVDPLAPGKEPLSRKIEASLYEDKESGTAVVQIKWVGVADPAGLIFEKKYSNFAAASAAFGDLLGKMRKVSEIPDPDVAREKVSELFDEFSKATDPLRTGHSTKVVNTSLTDGWDIVEKEGKLSVEFSDEFLGSVLKKYAAQDSDPIQPGEMTYSTSSKLHCGSDNFVVSYWRKVKTADGNIIRNAALVSRIGGKSFFVKNIPLKDYNLLCAALTPAHGHYGISYDSIAGKWIKTANFAAFLASKPEEIQMILDYLKGGAKPEGELELKPKGKEEKKEEESEETTEVTPESLPIPESATEEAAPAEGGELPEDQLMDLIKKEASNPTDQK